MKLVNARPMFHPYFALVFEMGLNFHMSKHGQGGAMWTLLTKQPFSLSVRFGKTACTDLKLLISAADISILLMSPIFLL